MKVRPGALGSVLQARTICAPPCPGMCARSRGCFGSVTSRIEVPLGSLVPVTRLTAEPP